LYLNAKNLSSEFTPFRSGNSVNFIQCFEFKRDLLQFSYSVSEYSIIIYSFSFDAFLTLFIPLCTAFKLEMGKVVQGPGPEYFFTGTGTATRTKIFFSSEPGPEFFFAGTGTKNDWSRSCLVQIHNHPFSLDMFPIESSDSL